MTTPLPQLWFTTGTSLHGWGDAPRYEAVALSSLSPLPEDKRDGSFAWLKAAPESPHALDFGDDGDDDAASAESVHVRLARIVAEARQLDLTVPGALVRFLDDEELHRRVPTCTACYLDVPDKLVTLPEGRPGRLLRFLNDGQHALLWYVHLLPGGDHQIVCARPEIGDASAGDTLDDVVTPWDLAICAPSFEDFLLRFWIENTLWFAARKTNR